MKPLIEVKNLSVAYEGQQVLQDASLTVYEKDYVGIIGPNGGGKTTLVKCLMGLLKPDSGQIVMPSPVTIGYLPQYNRIDKKFPISVSEVILSGLSGRNPLPLRFGKAQKDKAARVMERLGLSELAKRSIGTLSGGQLQRALLGRAMVADPDVLILDEPNTYLDELFEARLYRLLAELNERCAIVLVSHNLEEVKSQVKHLYKVEYHVTPLEHLNIS